MTCPICEKNKHKYLFIIHGFPIRRCEECGLISTFPYPTHTELSAFYEGNNLDNPFENWQDNETEEAAANRYLSILRRRAPSAKQIMVVAPPNHCFSLLAKEQGISVIESPIEEFEEAQFEGEPVDAILFLYQLEQSCFLQQTIDKAYALLKSEGTLIVITHSLDSHSAQFFKNAWTGWRPENHYYFDNMAIQSLLWKYGFRQLEIQKDYRKYTLSHINDRAIHFPKTWVTKTISLAYRLIPSFLRDRRIYLPSSGVVVCAKKEVRNEKPLLSIVVPVYNEEKTFSTLMDQLLPKEIEGFAKEIIIVESNSKDKSRQLVLGYKDCPEVRIVLQDKALGKGNAVREGFAHAQGDIVMIQDADLEYDLNDYEALLTPVLSARTPFVLGSRHGGSWKMRQFNDQKLLSSYLNFGHILFTTLVNVLYGQRMKDPFTMYKVFRRDCLYNLKFECNRFDFDYELLIKLIRKGYKPLEIPVNYRSRSYKDGKKVNIWRDPITWVKASFKYRFVDIYQNN